MLPHHNLARESHSARGVAVANPFPIVWSAPPGQVETLLSLEDEAFCLELTEAFEGRLGAVEWVGPRAAFPLRHQHAEGYVQRGLALVGDAAHAIHPLAGQGVNLGLLDAASLAEVVAEARDRGRGPGEYRVLEQMRSGEKALGVSVEIRGDERF